MQGHEQQYRGLGLPDGGGVAVAPTLGSPDADARDAGALMVDLSQFPEDRVVQVARKGDVFARVVLPARVALRTGDDIAISPWASSVGKRAFDVLAATVLIVVCAPVFLVVAIAIWIEDGRPFFFVQARAGKDGTPFRFLKFRSMIRDAEARKAALLAFNESSDGVIFKMRADPRITQVGALIRKTSLDELPQLFHVLSGKMSLVGPRPHPVAEAAAYTESQRVRLRTKPGLTCLWQIMGRSEIAFRQQVILDRVYIERQTLWLDVKILFLTLPAVLRGHGAY